MGKAATGKNPEPTIRIAQLWPDLAAFEYDQLLPKAEVFGNQSRSGLERGGEGADKMQDHQTDL